MTHEPALSPLRHIPGALGNTNLDNHQWTKEILWISRSPVEKFHNIFRGKTFQLKQLNRIRGIVQFTPQSQEIFFQLMILPVEESESI